MTVINGSRPRSTFSNRGFTLIELVIVLVIMGIVFAFAGPRVAGGLLGLNTRTAALQTAATLRYARSKAINTSCRYSVIFDGVKRRVILLQSNPDEASDLQSSFVSVGEDDFDQEDQLPEDSEDAWAGSAELEKKIYLLPDGVLFENLIIADVDSAEFGDESIMMLSFHPNGTSLGAFLTLADSRGRRYFITVEPVSGSVRVEEESDDD